MAKLSAVEAARLRMALVDEAKLLATGGMNTCEDIGAAYPRMLYRKTDAPVENVLHYDKFGKPVEVVTLNSFGGLLCDTAIVETVDEAEALFAEGWDISPSAAYGEQSPVAKGASAKDEEIAALKAELARRDERDAQLVPSTTPAGHTVDVAKRGPGRPRREDAETLAS